MVKYLLFFILLLGIYSCKEERGEDKYPEIQEIPKTSNTNVKISLLKDDILDLYYNDSLFVIADHDKLHVRNIKLDTNRIVCGKKLFYYDNTFIVSRKTSGYRIKEYLAISDFDFSERKIKVINENELYHKIIDSLEQLDFESTKINAKIWQSIPDCSKADSIYLKLFKTKYAITDETIVNSTCNIHYLKTAHQEFIIEKPASCLRQFLDSRKRKSKNNLTHLNKYSLSGSKYFRHIDYALIHKYWKSSGGNHYFPAIPEKIEIGYNYYEFTIEGHKGKFKIRSNRDTDIIEISDPIRRTLYFVNNTSLFELSY